MNSFNVMYYQTVSNSDRMCKIVQDNVNSLDNVM